jgi:hypothetical protein
MSDLNQINTALKRLFVDEGQRIVFWNDPDKEFQHTLAQLDLDGVNVLRLVLTDFAHHLKGDLPQSLRHLLLPRSGWANAVVCLAQ